MKIKAAVDQNFRSKVIVSPHTRTSVFELFRNLEKSVKKWEENTGRTPQ